MTQYDYVITNARIIDGTGSPWQRANLAINNGQIADIGNIAHHKAKKIIDAGDHYLVPGFIDIHTHADREVENMPLMENYLRQGVTTLFGGNCGHSKYPVHDHLESLDQITPAINYGFFVGHGSIRAAAMGLGMRAPSTEELTKMQRLATKAMEEGAYGMSLGLYYAPGSFAERTEVLAVSEAIGKSGGIITIHLRDESDYNIGLVDSVKEAIDIARQTGTPVQISHLKCLGKSVWGQAALILGLIEAARAEGLDVTFDQYPYPASGTSFTGAIIPRWALDGGLEALHERLLDPTTRAKIRPEMIANIERRGGANTLFVALHPQNPTLHGKNMQQVGELMGVEPVDAAIEMQIAGGASLVSFNMIDEDIHRIMSHPLGMVASDGGLVAPGTGMPHPRYYGTFPHFLGHYVRDKGVVALEEGIRKMTSAPARRLGLWNRGVIAPGNQADLVLLDYSQVGANSTFESPHQYNNGIKLVFVNGALVLDDARVLNDKSGSVLRGPARREVL